MLTAGSLSRGFDVSRSGAFMIRDSPVCNRLAVLFRANRAGAPSSLAVLHIDLHYIFTGACA